LDLVLPPMLARYRVTAWEIACLGHEGLLAWAPDQRPAHFCRHSSSSPNLLDLVLPPMLARYRVTAWEIAGLGHGGLLAWAPDQRPAHLCRHSSRL